MTQKKTTQRPLPTPHSDPWRRAVEFDVSHNTRENPRAADFTTLARDCPTMLDWFVARREYLAYQQQTRQATPADETEIEQISAHIRAWREPVAVKTLLEEYRRKPDAIFFIETHREDGAFFVGDLPWYVIIAADEAEAREIAESGAASVRTRIDLPALIARALREAGHE